MVHFNEKRKDMKTAEEILEGHCPSMSYLFLDKSGILFRERVTKAMKEYADQQLSVYKEKLKGAILHEGDFRPYPVIQLIDNV